jgi:hypothetical protein
LIENQKSFVVLQIHFSYIPHLVTNLNKTRASIPGAPKKVTIEILQILIGINKLKLTAIKLYPYIKKALNTSFFNIEKTFFILSPNK